MSIRHGDRRLSFTRSRWLRLRTRAALRSYLRVKAARGTFDERMFDYYGGIPHKVIARAKRAVRRAYARGLVVTATTNGKHAPGSFHNPDAEGLGHAVDFGLIEKEIGTDQGRRRLVNFQRSEYQEWAAGNRPGLVELIGPDNTLIVLRGKRATLPEGSPLENQHDNHVHEGWR